MLVEQFPQQTITSFPLGSDFSIKCLVTSKSDPPVNIIDEDIYNYHKELAEKRIKVTLNKDKVKTVF